MRIFFRYLLMRLLNPFLICLAACTTIWIMTDLYGNMDEFLDHKVNFLLILRFYSLQIPKMLVQVLPAAVLFSTLFTLLSLNRRSELVALQSGGMAPVWMFSPFILFGVFIAFILAVDLSGPAAQSQVTRDRLLRQVKGEKAGRNLFQNLIYVDNINRRVWYFESLDTGNGRVKNVELLLRDGQGHDIVKYFARGAQWTGEFWRFDKVLKIVYGVGGVIGEQKIYEELDLSDVTTPPQQLSLIVSQPEQLTFGQLSQYINTSTQTPQYLAKYRAEWWYRIFYPLSLLVLLCYALLQGTRIDRRSAVAGVFGAIFVLLAFTMVSNVTMAAGRFGRLSPFIGAIAPDFIFGLIGLYLLAVKNGWFSQLMEYGRVLFAQYFDPEPEEPAEPAA